MKTNPNDPIHPSVDETKHYGDFTEFFGGHGLTKREYFAAMALQGFCSDIYVIKTAIGNTVAELAIEYADALIEELNKPTE